MWNQRDVINRGQCTENLVYTLNIESLITRSSILYTTHPLVLCGKAVFCVLVNSRKKRQSVFYISLFLNLFHTPKSWTYSLHYYFLCAIDISLGLERRKYNIQTSMLIESRDCWILTEAAQMALQPWRISASNVPSRSQNTGS